jgi:hypothetical protein
MNNTTIRRRQKSCSTAEIDFLRPRHQRKPRVRTASTTSEYGRLVLKIIDSTQDFKACHRRLQ